MKSARSKTASLGFLKKSLSPNTSTSKSRMSPLKNVDEISPKHELMKDYYKEGDLVLEAKSFSLNSHRYATNLMDNKGPILNSIFKRNIENSYKGIMKR